MRPAVKAALSDADKAVNLDSVIQGHVGTDVRQIFTIKRTASISNKRLGMDAAEYIKVDQFGNLYVQIAARLMDGEVYVTTAWVGIEKWTDRGKELVLVKEWKKFKTFSDALIDAIRLLAFHSLGQTNLAVMKARHAARQVADLPSNVVRN